LTRPSMLFGVTYTFAILNGFFCTMTYVIFTDFKYFFMMFPIHAMGYYLSMKEPLFVELYMIKLSRFSRCANKIYHGSNSYDPS